MEEKLAYIGIIASLLSIIGLIVTFEVIPYFIRRNRKIKRIYR